MEKARGAMAPAERGNCVTTSPWHGHVYFSIPNQWAAMQWPTWLPYLCCRPAAWSTATSPGCVRH